MKRQSARLSRQALHQFRAGSCGNAFKEPVGKPGPNFALLGGILDAVLKVGIVVDLDDENTVLGLLEINAIKPLNDGIAAQLACRLN